VITHWDELPWQRMERGHIAGDWQSLTGDRSVTVGVKRIRVDPGKWSTPAHVENSEEEIFYVLSGSGVSWQDGACYDVRPGDCLVHTARTEAHTLRAGEGGLEVLAFGERHAASGARLPRAGVSWGLGAWVRTGDPEDHPWKLEAELGPPDVGDVVERPRWIVNVDDIEAEPFAHGEVDSVGRDLGVAAESVRTGLSHVTVPPGKWNVPLHCHSVEEEIFVVLEGEGEVELAPGLRVWPDALTGTFPVRVGTAVARPAGSRVAHRFRAGAAGLTLLAYGTRDPSDVAYYPRSGKVNLRGIGLVFRPEPLDYWDGEA
jgi:uncharacterized cupin superfamily protein